jgi:hypothetical protein
MIQNYKQLVYTEHNGGNNNIIIWKNKCRSIGTGL